MGLILELLGIEQPATPALPEFTIVRGDDGSVQFDRTTPDGVSVRKKFLFPPNTENKDNFVAEMDVDFRNDGAEPYTNAGYFVSLGSTRPLHPNDMPSYTRLVWCIEGKPKATDVLWKSPWGLRSLDKGFATAANSHVAWSENYEGGWQELFPNAGESGIELFLSFNAS